MKNMKTEQLRLFIGIPLNEKVREEIIAVTEILKNNIGGVRWVRPENWHVTIMFLGTVPVDMVPNILDVLDRISLYLPFELEIDKIGAFSSLASARVVWVRAYDESGTVHKIYDEIENGVKKLGFPGEKRGYYPHITIGRSKKKPVRIGVEMVEDINFKCLLPVNQVVLFQSELKKTGAEYSILGSACGVSQDST